ncbi:phosphoketolase family protein [Asaia siamensis]|uniref:Probable phosphoketolase n=1 Tax=Asaia siamensis TaxID=110479 RepID=A0ABQ1M076_9PROT|nr:phosphoketolase family protein [Asaia siamensis]GBR10075.1 phosphoketolase [Asaia siamensis NRIC 0323]GGC32505.1 putative phosphoketolase [Asaia siamensis]
MTEKGPLSTAQLALFDKWWQAANYLSVAQIYLLDNPLLRDPLKIEHVKPRLLGHFGTTPGLTLLYLHLNRIIKERQKSVLFIAGPGHGAPGVVAATYLEGTYSEYFPEVSQDVEGLGRLVKQFSFPGGIPSHVAATTPGSIHEGGELGYSVSHAYGAVLDNPDLVVACVVGDGEAETGPLATSWHSNKFLDPRNDGAVLPILHLNGYKIANPTVLARIPETELLDLFRGYGYEPIIVKGSDPDVVHQAMAKAMDECFDKIAEIQKRARTENSGERPTWPMIIMRTPKGWTGPKEVDGQRCEGYWRSHQVPLTDIEKPGHLKILEDWMRSYKPETLFDENGRLHAEIAALAPEGTLRMSDNPHANGGQLRRPLRMPDIEGHALTVPSPGAVQAESTRILGSWLRDVMRMNLESRNFRVLSPDENNSNRLNDVLEVTNRAWTAETRSYDDHLAPDGLVMEILSEHTIQGWLEGYLLTGRHGFFSCYEAFVHLVDSMVNQHAKWIKSAKEVQWRRPIASLNYLLTSHVWRQDHNGFSHQDPGFMDHVVNKKADIARVYLPPDANTLLYVAKHCLESWDRINVIVAGKQPEHQWLDMDAAIAHCSQGIGIWQWASNDKGYEPDLVIASAGDVPTVEALAAIQLLREHTPDLKVRFVNVVDLMTLQSPSEHPHGLDDVMFDNLFTKDKPVLFAFHGYPQLVHRLIYRRSNRANFHVHGFREEGTTTTPFDMTVRNNLDRYHIILNAVRRVTSLSGHAAYVTQMINDKLVEHKRYIAQYGQDMPEILNWKWQGNRG